MESSVIKYIPSERSTNCGFSWIHRGFKHHLGYGPLSVR